MRPNNNVSAAHTRRSIIGSNYISTQLENTEHMMMVYCGKVRISSNDDYSEAGNNLLALGSANKK
jgi:hypothetical protein